MNKVIIPADQNIYTDGNSRELVIGYAIPIKGTNMGTGNLIIAPGCGEHIDSKLKYNLRNYGELFLLKIILFKEQ